MHTYIIFNFGYLSASSTLNSYRITGELHIVLVFRCDRDGQQLSEYYSHDELQIEKVKYLNEAMLAGMTDQLNQHHIARVQSRR